MLPTLASIEAGEQRTRNSIPGKCKIFFSSENAQIGFTAYPSSYSVDTWSTFPWGKAAEAGSEPLTPSSVEVKNE
jgi:hypothetical protein